MNRPPKHVASSSLRRASLVSLGWIGLVLLALALPSCGQRRERAGAWRAAPAESGAAQGQGQVSSTGEYTLRFGGSERSYELYAPPSAGAASLPLVIMLHGGLGNAESIRSSTRMDEVAKRHGFLVAYPNGTGVAVSDRRTWNAGTCCGPAQRRRVDDVGFVDALIRDIAKRHSVDTSRVYATGMSNGGMMAYRLACELPDAIAAAVVVSGAALIDDCSRGKDVPILHIHGDSDENVRFEGGKGRFVRTIYPSVAASLGVVTRDRACAAPTTETVGGDQISTYECARGATVKMRKITGGGHKWPDGSSSFRGFSASDAVWEFASLYRKAK